MKPMSLNMSRYRKIAEDGEKSTLEQHDTGHQITIAHKALPRDQRNYLKALPLYSEDHADPVQSKANLADGGEVKNVPRGTFDVNALKKKKPNKMSAALKEKYETVPRGTMNKAHYDQGTPDKPVSAQDASEPNPSPSEPNPAPSMPNPSASTPININIGTPTTAQNAVTPQVSQPQAASPPQQDSGLSTAASQINALQGNAPQPTSPEAAPQLNTNMSNMSFPEGVQREATGLGQIAQATGALGQAQAPIEDQAAKNYAENAQRVQSNYQDISQQIQHLTNDVNANLVNPNKYWDNHSKIATGLGLIIAGFNPTNRPNAALEFLQNNIQRDTQAQMSNLGAKEDVLNHYYQMFGNNLAASEFVNASKEHQVASQLRAAAARSQNAMQAGIFNQEAGKLEQASSQRLIPLAMQQGAMQGMRNGTDPSQILPYLRASGEVGEKLAQGIEQHSFPSGTWGGGGSTDRPVPQATIDKIAAQSNILQKVERLRQFQQQETLGQKLDPATRAEGDLLAGEVLQYYSQGTDVGVSEGGREHVKQILKLDHPNGLFADYMNDPKLRALEQSIGDSIQNTKNSFNFHPYNGTPASQSQVAAPNPQPQGATPSEIQMKDGKPYKPVKDASGKVLGYLPV